MKKPAPAVSSRPKRKVNPHDPLLPLSIWVPRAIAFAQTMESLNKSRHLQAASCSLPKGWSLNARYCRIRCFSCPHYSFSKPGHKGRRLSLAVSDLSRKYKAVENIVTSQKQLEHFTLLTTLRVKSLSRDYPVPSPRPEGDFTPIPFHMLAWKIIKNNREVIALQHALRDWNTQNNRAHEDQVTRQGALGFKLMTLASGALYPRWVIWTRGDMGQWIGHKKATPTFRKGYKNPSRIFPIPIRLTSVACARTGNKKHKMHYLSMEKARDDMLMKIRYINPEMRSLAQLQAAVSKIKVNKIFRGLL